MNGSVNIKYSK